MTPFLPGLLALALPFVSAGNTWCGKHYESGSSTIHPGGKFPTPSKSSPPLLNFRCWPHIKPYLAGETTGEIIIDLSHTTWKIPGAQTFQGGSGPFNVAVSATVNGSSVMLASKSIPANLTTDLLWFNLSSLPVSTKPITIHCSATLEGKTYKTTTKLSHLPLPGGDGTVTKQDYLTGALLVSASGDVKGPFKPIIPFGFYTTFDTYLKKNYKSVIATAQKNGRNVINIVPPFLNTKSNLAVFGEILKELDKLKGDKVYLMYDLRDDYQSLAKVEKQVNDYKHHKSLLLWYTADEPDGWSYPENSTRNAGDKINTLDPYHPVSLVLNCQDYKFAQYSRGASILMHDPYPVDINPHVSSIFHTPCNSTFGDCGCDGCAGNFGDLTSRADLFARRLQQDGRSRGISVWSVPQAFGGEGVKKSPYWPRPPTTYEFLLQLVITLNHGSKGIIPWTEDENMSKSLKSTSGLLGNALPTIASYILSPSSTITHLSRYSSKTPLDITAWRIGGHTLILGGNMVTKSSSKSFGSYGAGATIKSEFSHGAKATISSEGKITVDFKKYGSFALVVTSPANEQTTS